MQVYLKMIRIKEFLFDKLYIWAKNKALTKTKQCYRNTEKNSILKDCEGEWSDPEGQDLAPIKDATVTSRDNYGFKLYLQS